jgi:hypothetical protein
MRKRHLPLASMCHSVTVQQRYFFIECQLFKDELRPFFRGKARIHPRPVNILSHRDGRCRHDPNGRDGEQKEAKTGVPIEPVFPRVIQESDESHLEPFVLF